MNYYGTHLRFLVFPKSFGMGHSNKVNTTEHDRRWIDAAVITESQRTPMLQTDPSCVKAKIRSRDG